MSNVNNKKSGLTFIKTLFLFATVPMMTALIIVEIFFTVRFNNALETSTYSRLQACATSVNEYYSDKISDSTYDLVGTDSLEFIDSLVNQGIELTVFKADTRAVTSIKDKSNSIGRNIGTKASDGIWTKVKSGTDYKSSGVVINGEKYYVYYSLLKDSDGSVWGMAFAGEKQSMVTAEKRSIIFTTVGMVIVIFAGFTVLAIVLAKKMSASLKKIDNALNETAEGSLSADTDAKSSITEIKNLIGATQTLQGKLQEIIRETSDIADELAENVGEMTEVTGTAADSSGQISNAVEDLSSGAVSLAENVQNISDKVMQMSEDIANIAEDVDRLNYASEKMKTASEISVEYMVKVADSSNESANGVSTIVKQVKDTNNAISKIDEAIEMISSITEQTNLLSLNASIEAARAGEAGKGFAVVADEIRNLATQSSNSADEISHIVSEIKAQSAATVQTSEHVVKLINDEQKFMEESKSKFGDMESGINSTIDYTQSIAARMSGLDEARKEIAGNVSDLGAISQENAASNEEVTSSVENIAGTIKTINQKSRGINEMSARLKGVISYFRG